MTARLLCRVSILICVTVAALMAAGPAAATPGMVGSTTTGFFCTADPNACGGLPNQHLIYPYRITPECGPVLAIDKAGILVGGYVDDTTANEHRVAWCSYYKMWGQIWSGSYGLADNSLPNDLVEWYPVLDHHSNPGWPPNPGHGGYILQSFSWGDNLSDGQAQGRCGPASAGWTQASCAAQYQAPDFSQLQEMWCKAWDRHPKYIYWYYAGGEQVQEIFNVMATDCTSQLYVG